MNIIKPYAEVIRPNMDGPEGRNAIYQLIERAGRTCYKSEANITPESAAAFVKKIVQNRHEAMLEHAHMTVLFVLDRGVSHELVRHRMASYAQESTRYCNYSRDMFGHEITVIKPYFFEEGSEEYEIWKAACLVAEDAYFDLIEAGRTPQEARSVLPNSLKTEVVMTANMREWRHVFSLRAAGTTGAPHPQMAEAMVPLMKKCQEYMPELFGDISMK